MGVYGTTGGVWPDVYENWAQLAADTSYILNVCEGTWTISPPNFQDYVANPPQAVVTVPEKDTTIVVNFNYSVTGIQEKFSTLPKKFELDQNYPNPFNPITHIRFGLPKRTHIVLEIYNLLGQKIATLANGDFAPGYHIMEWNASQLPSGI